MMDSLEALKVILQHRGNAIVVGAHTAAREWGQISDKKDLDLPCGAAMSKVSSVGLGIALGRPDVKVLVFDGDGSLVMNLGTLLTIANMAPPNLIHFVFQNRIYRTTGGQPVPDIDKFSFIELARTAGYPNVYEFDKLENFKENMGTIMSQAGPTFVCLKVPSIIDKAPPYPRLGTTVEIIARLNSALGTP
jgi:thiamine pyrophosphate-dependent acetolactate synthase large subunit-like protein